MPDERPLPTGPTTDDFLQRAGEVRAAAQDARPSATPAPYIPPARDRNPDLSNLTSLTVDVRLNLQVDVEIDIEQLVEDELRAMGADYADFEIVSVTGNN